jgi:hypothetical protein
MALPYMAFVVLAMTTELTQYGYHPVYLSEHSLLSWLMAQIHDEYNMLAALLWPYMQESDKDWHYHLVWEALLLVTVTEVVCPKLLCS